MLRALPIAMARKIAPKALRKTGKHLLEKTKDATPVDEGNLRKALKLRTMKRSKARSGVFIPLPTRGDLGISATDPGYYPAIIEFGQEGVPANPYIRGTRDREEGRIRGMFVEEVANGISEVTGGA